MRVRILLTLAVAAALAALIIDMSGRAPRTAGSDHASPIIFAATVPGHGTLCQPAAYLPQDAAQVQILIGSYGRPLGDLRLSFLDAAGHEVAYGRLPAGGHEGLLLIPIMRIGRAAAGSTVCLRNGGSYRLALGGEGGAVNPNSEVVNGIQQPGRMSLVYFRAGKESWWSLLPELTRRFGLGKAPFFGSWTLPAAALLLLAVWIAALRLLVRGERT
ncbi:MAG: hypothetical protein JWN81_1966 [Solirubrobacterales bacterium]|nr:hypothetical protein [Solirubrobacterales bacterium]